jgi:GNAT superfamily N-acetyltransferase
VNNEPSIRLAAESDVERVVRLQRAWQAENTVYGFVSRSAEEMHSVLGNYFLVAEAGAELVAFATGNVYKNYGTAAAVVPESNIYLEIDEIYIVPTHRHRGLGSLLIDRLLKTARAEGVTHATLYSSIKDIGPVMQFYEKHGFESWSIQMFKKL